MIVLTGDFGNVYIKFLNRLSNIRRRKRSMQQITGKDKVSIGHDTMFDFTKTILSITIFHLEIRKISVLFIIKKSDNKYARK